MGFHLFQYFYNNCRRACTSNSIHDWETKVVRRPFQSSCPRDSPKECKGGGNEKRFSYVCYTEKRISYVC